MTLFRWAWFLLLISAHCAAQDRPPPLHQGHLSSVHYSFKTMVSDSPQGISLTQIQLSDKARRVVHMRVRKALVKPLMSTPSSDSGSLQLGMGHVPVFQQGSYATSATFAITAAIDAVLGKGDYLSQLCLLQLGRHLEKHGYKHSGWNGALSGATLLHQLDSFGLVSKDNQLKHGCAGLTIYPESSQTTSQAPGEEMTLNEYYALSEELNHEIVAWSSIIDPYEVYLDKTSMDKILAEVKNVLKEGDRVTFGVLLPAAGEGVAGAVGQHQVPYDSWVLTHEIAEDMRLASAFAAHTMVITGYDDDAEATDNKGRIYRGLFTLRSSWGEGVGHHGNFYMTYDYFKALVIEAQRIRRLPG